MQGVGSAEDICQAIADLNAHRDLEVLIVGRGGGSLEDLWSFNEECVARAIAASRLPIVSAVGHEVDFTIADFVADRRAPTPTAAAELVVPRLADLRALVARGQPGSPARSRGGAPASAATSSRWRAGSAIRGGGCRISAPRATRWPSASAAAMRRRLAKTRAATDAVRASTRRPASGRARRGARADGRACGSTALELAGRRALVVAQDRVARAAASLDDLSPLAVLAARVQSRAAGLRRRHRTRPAGRSRPGTRVQISFAEGSAARVSCRATATASGRAAGGCRMTDQKPQKFEDGLAELEATVASSSPASSRSRTPSRRSSAASGW